MSRDTKRFRKSISPAAHGALIILVATLAAGQALGQPPPGPPPALSPKLEQLTRRAGEVGLAPGALGDMFRRGREAGFAEEQLAALGDRVLRIADQDLPCLQVLNRVHQGFAKGAPFDRIEAACDRLETRLREGAGLVDRAFPNLVVKLNGRPPGPGPGDRLALIDQTAFALEKGVPPASVEAVFSDFRVAGPPVEQARAVGHPLIAVTSLVSEGVPPGTSMEFVAEACRRGVCGSALTDLSLAMAHAMRAGDRDEILSRVMNSLRRGVPPRAIIQGLPGGPPPGGMQPPHHPPPGSLMPGTSPPGSQPGGARPPDDPGRRGGHGEGRGRTPRGRR